MKKVIHPARYSDVLLPALGRFLRYMEVVLDPFGGTGERLARLREFGVSETARLLTVEIEPEWGTLPVPGVTRVIGDATDLPFRTESIEAVVTSPTYGNRFADRHRPREKSKRRSYTYDLRAATGDPDRELHPRNTGAMQWGPRYRFMHAAAWGEAFRVLVPGGFLVLNVSDHVRAWEVVPVTDWHLRCLRRIGFQVLVHQLDIVTPRMRYGANREARVDAESVVVLWRPPVDRLWRPTPGARPSAIVQCEVEAAARETEADELEGRAVRRLTESGREAHREHLAERADRVAALRLAHGAGFDPRDHDATCEDGRALRRFRVPRSVSKKRGYRRAADDFNEAIEAISAEVPRFGDLQGRRDAGEDSGELLAEVLLPLLQPPRGVEEFATYGATREAEDMLREAKEARRDAARLERLLS